MKKHALIKYRVVVQHLEEKQEGYPDRATYENLFDDYSKAKKVAVKLLRSLQLNNFKVLRASIEPVLLEENLLGN